MSKHDYRNEASRQLSETRREFGERSILAFGRIYLSHYCKLPSSRMHTESCELLQSASRNRGSRLAIAAPRDHAKSTLVSLTYVLWAICYQRETFILLISNTGDQASDLLSFVKDELEGNLLLQADFPLVCEIPKVKPGAARWRKTEIITRNSVKVSALGADMKVRGRRNRQYRPSLIILDDVENETSVRSQDQRRNLKEWFTKTVAKAGSPTTNIIVVGTLLHYDSLLARMVNDNAQHTWTSRKYQAVRTFSCHPELWQEWEAILTSRSEYRGASGKEAACAYFKEHESLMLEGTDAHDRHSQIEPNQANPYP